MERAAAVDRVARRCNGTLYANINSANIVAFNAADGMMLWSKKAHASRARGSIWSSPSADLQAGLAFGATANNHGPPATDTSDSIIAFDPRRARASGRTSG